MWRWRLSDYSDCLRDKWVETAVPAETVLSQPVLPAATSAGKLYSYFSLTVQFHILFIDMIVTVGRIGTLVSFMIMQ